MRTRINPAGQPPRLVAIIGGSGAGKTYLAAKLASLLGEDVLRLTLDDFYRDRSRCPPARRDHINFDHPRAIDWPAFESVLKRLARGQPARAPQYDFATHTRLPSRRLLAPKSVILVEGLWPCYRRAIRKLFDLKIFLACPMSTRLRRRLERDLTERGRGAESVRRQFYKTVAPMHKRFVGPQIRWADVVVGGPLAAPEMTRLARRIAQIEPGKKEKPLRLSPARRQVPSAHGQSVALRVRTMLSLGLFFLCLGAAAPVWAGAGFVHPGLLQSREDLARMKAAVAAKQEPIFSGYEVFRKHPQSQTSYVPRGPFDEIGRNPNLHFSEYDRNANAAYQCALMWTITGDIAYADKAKTIINAWTSTLKKVSGRDAVLMAGLGPFKMIHAAEILRYTDAGWTEADTGQCEQWCKEVTQAVGA
jgi:uridine kinase